MTVEQARAFVARYGEELRALGERVAADLANEYELYERSPRVYSADVLMHIHTGRVAGHDVVLAGQVAYKRSAARPYATALLLVGWETEEVFAEALDEEPMRVWRRNPVER